MAENNGGIDAPTNKPKNTVGFSMSKPVNSSISFAAAVILTSLIKAQAKIK